MSRSFAAPTKDALNAGRVKERGLILFDFGSGLYGFWTGQGVFNYLGVSHVGAGSLITVEGLHQTADLSATQVIVKLTSVPNSDLTPDVLANIENEQWHQRPVTIMTAYFDPDTSVLLSVETEYRGYADKINFSETVDGEATLEGVIESRFRDHQKTGYRVRSDVDQRLIDLLDDGLRHVAIVATEPVLFGKVAQSAAPSPAPAKKKGFFASIFG